jgi:hypothetical protein
MAPPPPPPAPAPTYAAPAQATGVAAAPSKNEPKTGVELTTLRLLLSKGLISQAEYDSAVKDLTDTMGMRVGEANTVVLGKWATSFYGFTEADAIYDTTESFNEVQGNAGVQRAIGGTRYAANNDRMMFDIRNSRFGFRLKAPEFNSIRASGVLEMDFFGGSVNSASGLGAAPTPNVPGAPAPGTANQEGVVFNNSILRVRHMYLKVETPILDVLFGQYWTLFGWHAQYLPPTVQIQGITGEIFSRQVQLQLSKTIKTDDYTLEVALAAQRPVQRDSAMPVGQGGVRFAYNKWTAPQTLNWSSTSIQPASIAVTGDVRYVRVPSLWPVGSPQNPNGNLNNDQVGEAIAIDAFIPVLPGTKEARGNSLAIDGEFATGAGYQDMYTGFTGGTTTAGFLPAAVAADYNPRIDNGIAYYDPGGGLHLLQTTSFFVGLQYYLPGPGNWWVTGNYARIQTSNMTGNFPQLPAPPAVPTMAQEAAVAAAKGGTLNAQDFFDFNVYWDMTPAIRWGIEYANTHTSYNDGLAAVNHRGQFTGSFLF